MAQVLMVGGGGTDTSGVTAIAGHVLNPDVFVNSDGQEVEGTMVDNSDTDIRLDNLGEGWIPFLTSTTGTGLLVVKIPSTGYYKQWNSSQSTVNRLSWSAGNLGNAQAQHVLDTATFTSRYGIKQTGSIPSKAAETKHPVLTNMTDKVNITIASGQYLSGAQVIRGVTVSDTWTAANIKSGVKISVGDTSSVEALTVRTGTYTNVSSGQLALVAAALRTGYSGYANGGAEVRGSMATYTTPTAFTPSQSPITIQVGGKYVSSNLTINAITYPSTFAEGNIKKGVTISIGGKSIKGMFEGFVPDALDIYKNGSWGTGYGTSIFLPVTDYRSSTLNYSAAITFQTAAILVDASDGYYGIGSKFYINKSINLQPYATWALQFTMTFPTASGNSDNFILAVLATKAAASVASYSDTTKDWGSSSNQNRIASATSATSWTNTSTNITKNIALSNISSSAYLGAGFWSLAGTDDNLKYSIKRIYFT